MTLLEKIKSIYPELSDIDFMSHRGGTITLQNDGQGDYIAKWEHPTYKKPTLKQLAGVK